PARTPVRAPTDAPSLHPPQDPRPPRPTPARGARRSSRPTRASSTRTAPAASHFLALCLRPEPCHPGPIGPCLAPPRLPQRAPLVPLRPAALAVVAAPRAHHRLELLRRHRTSSHCVCGPNRAIKAASASACPSPFFSSAAQRGHSWIARDLAASLSVPTSPA